ncbi:MAG: mechanosensitive ion channel [Planctomycetales bacterium]|nr:mechanosensitive ion channel [Planctomycetales bacterium]
MLPVLFADLQSTLQQAVSRTVSWLMSIPLLTEERKTYVMAHVVPAIAILIIGRWALKFGVRTMDRAFERYKVDETLAKFLGKLAYYAGLVLILISTAARLDVPTQQLTAIVAASGLAIGLALKDSLSNFASGVMIIMFRPFSVGDVIEVAGTKGKVEAIHVFNTLVNSPDNVKTFVPNGSIMAGNITNYSRERYRRVDLEIGCGYGDDLPRVKRFLELTVRNHPLVLSEPEPVVAVNELADSCVTFVVRPWVANADYWKVRWDLTEQIKIGFDANGFEIPFPQRSVHVISSSQANAKHASEESPIADEQFPVQPRRVA